MLKKITIAVVLGIVGTIFFTQYDPWMHKKIVIMLQKIANDSLGGHFSCSIQSVSFFTPSLVLHNLEMKSIEPDAWAWKAKKCEINCSWIHLLFKGIMEQYIVMDGFECTTRAHGRSCAIEHHIIAMTQKSFLPFTVELKSIIFRNSSLHAHDEQYKTEILLFFNSSSLRIGQQIKTTMSLNDGKILYEHNNYVEKIAADLSFITQYCGNSLDVEMHITGACLLSHMGQQGGCYVTGGWKSDHGRFSIRNAHNHVMIDPIVITEREIRLNGRFPLSYVAQCMRNSYDEQIISGKGNFSVKLHRDESRAVDGQLVVEDFTINQHHLCDTGKIIFGRHNDDWKMRLTINRYNQECKGTGYWHELTKKGELVLKNSTNLTAKSFPYWYIQHNNCYAYLTVDQDTVHGTYQASANNRLSDAMHNLLGDISCTQDMATAQGTIDSNNFSVEASLHPHISLNHFLYKDKENKQLIALHATEDKQQILGSISFPFIRSMINNIMHYDLQGEGSLNVVAALSSEEIVADVALHDATIRLPQTYNFIDGFNAHCRYSLAHKSAVCENINLSLHTGKVNCLHATAHFDQHNSLIFAHAPFLVDRCLLNIKKDLFAIVSGNLLFTQKASSPLHMDGHIIIDKAQLKENLFSGIIQKQLLSYTHSMFSVPDVPLHYNFTIETKSPIHVDTGFLQTKAHMHVRVQKDTHDPTVTGSIALHSGVLNFPYKPLYISRGLITFTPDQLFDPAIELVARNKIKKYDVSLQVEGSLSTHHIMLDSTPPLSEEQIVALLLVGAEENSLNSMMPALIVQNLKNLILSNNQSSFFDKYFKPLLGSFNVNLVPSFTDQTGRGGLRGALEISVDDRWRAVIQKNFSLTEDTKFELEFLLSDDITLRAIRDERRDIGGEVEMRWKF